LNLLTFHCVSGSAIVMVVILRVDISVTLDVEVMRPVKVGHFDGLGHPSQIEVGKKLKEADGNLTALQSPPSASSFSCHVVPSPVVGLGGNKPAPTYNCDCEQVRALCFRLLLS
jgi:hypothetical protein